MHPPSERSAEHHAGGPVEAHPLELRPALLAVAGDLAHPDFVTDHLHWLAALCLTPGENISERKINVNKRESRQMSSLTGPGLYIVRNKRLWLLIRENSPEIYSS